MLTEIRASGKRLIDGEDAQPRIFRTSVFFRKCELAHTCAYSVMEN
jgi:hypothetical protein